MRVLDLAHAALTRRAAVAAMCAAILAGGTACAAGPAPAAKGPSGPQVEALRQALNAVVRLHVSATDGASSSRSLGEERDGTGVFIDPDGLILTIGYLLIEADSVEVTTQDDRTWPARVVAYDQATGFGLVQPLVPIQGIKPAPMGSVAGLAKGEALMVSTAGEGELGVGVTRLVDRRPFTGYWEYHIDTALFTAPAVPNHSGAPVFNHKGELVGIGSLFVLNAGGRGKAVPGNMFVPVDLLNPVLAEMRATGSTRASRRPWLGVSSQEKSGHVQIVRLDSEGPARAAGLQVGDVVLEVDGKHVDSLEAFYKKVWTRPQPDDAVELTVQHGSVVRKIRFNAVDRMQTLRKPAGI